MSLGHQSKSNVGIMAVGYGLDMLPLEESVTAYDPPMHKSFQYIRDVHPIPATTKDQAAKSPTNAYKCAFC